MGRFTDLPGRLRSNADLLGAGGVLELGDTIAITGMMRDSALKIEALEAKAKFEREGSATRGQLWKVAEWLHQQANKEFRAGNPELANQLSAAAKYAIEVGYEGET